MYKRISEFSMIFQYFKVSYNTKKNVERSYDYGNHRFNSLALESFNSIKRHDINLIVDSISNRAQTI